MAELPVVFSVSLRPVVPSYVQVVVMKLPFTPETTDVTRRPKKSYVDTELVTMPQSEDSVTT